MPDGFALAALSQALRTRVRQAITEAADVAQTGQFDIVSKHPELLASPTPGKATLTLYPCRLVPNPGWASSRQAAYSPRGERRANSLLALDVQYVLAGYSPEAGDVERVLGLALLGLHETPQLSRSLLLAAASGNFPANSPLPQALRDLADQPAPITIAPQPLELEALSQLWSTLNSGVRTGMVYLVGTLLMESRRRAASAPPVREGRLSVTQLRAPNILRTLFATTTAGPFRERTVASPGEILRIEGSGLRGDVTRLLVGDRSVAVDPAALRPDRLEAALPGNLRPGLVTLQVQQDWPKPKGKQPPPATGVVPGERSNIVPIAIRPVLAGAGTFTVDGRLDLPDGKVSFDVTAKFAVPVGRKQRFELLLNATTAAADGTFGTFAFAAPTPTTGGDTNTTQRKVTIVGVAAGTYLARVVVDGAESALNEDATGVTGPIVTVPA
ncbi:MAG TPA: DUF4255 domain-containing protein [Sphingomicrobium sp.]|nr:DUF4255 domain-containing protein [Sphingomicrobium sp.]